VALLLLQRKRIQELQKEQAERHDAAVIARRSLNATQESLRVCNDRCGWNKAVEDIYGFANPLSLKVQ
jgi:hypothetical protein